MQIFNSIHSRGKRMTKIAKLQKFLEETGLKPDEDLFPAYSVRDLITVDVAVLHKDRKIAFMESLDTSKAQKLTNLGWKPVQIPRLKLLTRQWLQNVLAITSSEVRPS
jgi:hypothetical protein